MILTHESMEFLYSFLLKGRYVRSRGDQTKMKALPITVEDEQLIKAAKDTIQKFYKYGKHHIGAALLTKSDKIFTAVILKRTLEG